jgi:DNA-binding transcriptional LysR family regulator
MTLEQLRIFVAVAEREHMTRAADAVGVTQSAASAAIATLEARHAIKLFHRVGRGIELTDAGRFFLGEARAVLTRAAEAELALGEYAGLKRGHLRLVASQTIAAYWLPERLAAFTAAIPRSNSPSRSPTPKAPHAACGTARPNWASLKGRSMIHRSRTGRWAKTACCW